MRVVTPLTIACLSLGLSVMTACSKPPSPAAEETQQATATTDSAEAGATDTPKRSPAQSEFDELVAKAKATHGAGQPAVWTMADEDTTIYLLGTVHILRPDTIWQSDEIMDALNSAETIVLEADVSSPAAQQEMAQLVLSEGLFKDGRTLSDILSERQEINLAKILKTMDVPFSSVQPMRPWFAALTMSNIAMVRGGFDPESGVEVILSEKASNSDKELDFLETARDQILILSGLPEDAQVDFLMSSADSLGDTPEMLDVLVSEWADGDVTGLGVLMSDPDAMGSEIVYEALLKRRNEDWVPKIEHMLEEPGTRLIAVGAAHLAGEDSVIKMLRAEGYEVEGP